MQKPSLGLGALVGALTSLPLLALFYLGEKAVGLPFAPFILFDWMARVLPGDVVTFGIDTMVDVIRTLNLGPTSETAKGVEQFLALVMIIAGGALLGFVVAFVRRRALSGRGDAGRPEWSGPQLGAALGLVAFIVTVIAAMSLGLSGNPLLVTLWLILLWVGWGTAVGSLVDSSAANAGPADAERRDALLKLVGGSLGLALGAWGVGRLFAAEASSAAAQTGAGQPLPPALPTTEAARTPAVAATATATQDLGNRIEPAPGTRPEVTSNEAFYRIDINTRPPVIDGDTWQLEVAGLFENTGPLTLDDLMAYPAVTQPITLSCISNRIGGDLIGTSYWTGVRLRDVVNDLQLKPEAGALFLEAEDGFYETVVMDDILDERTLLVYGMNDETLPIEHGFPLRIYIPNRYGMKQPKWIVRMEAIEAWAPGYWVDRGWSREARPHIISVVDTIATDAASDGRVPIGGIAWAGSRGIQKVEVKVDNGAWTEAQLRKPPLSTLAWVQWRYDWPAQSGQHTFTVRATDGTGALQIAEETSVRPDGATGYHSKTARFG